MGRNGGPGLGGGLFINTPGLAVLQNVTITRNLAIGGAAGAGGSAGPGVGGGVYIVPGAVVTKDALTQVFANDATTSNDDVFGTFS